MRRFGEGSSQRPSGVLPRWVLSPRALETHGAVGPEQHVLTLEAVRSTAAVLGHQQPPPPPFVAPAYHTYAQLRHAVQEVANQHQDLVEVRSIGQSAEGRDLMMARVTANVETVHADRPAILITAGQHGREHLGVEMALFILEAFAARYRAPDEKGVQITRLLDSVVVFIVFNLNPDGSEYDLAVGPGVWRKNRQPTSDPAQLGVDLNRNWGFHWRETSAASPANIEYEGPAAFSAPETRAVRDFVTVQMQPGHERIRASIDWHSFAEAVMYPFGYTSKKVVDGEMSAVDHERFVKLAKKMRDDIPPADTKEKRIYQVCQSSQLGIGSKSGCIIDWLWGAHGIFAFTIEMYPPSWPPPNTAQEGFRPDPTSISRETMRAFGAVLALLEAVADPAFPASLDRQPGAG